MQITNLYYLLLCIFTLAIQETSAHTCVFQHVPIGQKLILRETFLNFNMLVLLHRSIDMKV